MAYSWTINEVDSYLINDNYEQLKQLSYAEKIHVFKYLNTSWWNIKYWDEADKNLFYQVNIYVNQSIEHKLKFAITCYDNSIDKIIDIYKELTYEDSVSINLFKYINKDQISQLSIENENLFKEHIRYKYKNNYSQLLAVFIPLFEGELTKSGAKSYHFDTRLMDIINTINFITSIYPECIYDDEFNYNINALLYVHFTTHYFNCSSYSNQYALTKQEKCYISKIFTSKTKIKRIESILFIFLWLNDSLTIQEQRSLLDKFNFKNNEERYNKNHLIDILNKIEANNAADNKLITNFKFELSLK